MWFGMKRLRARGNDEKGGEREEVEIYGITTSRVFARFIMLHKVTGKSRRNHRHKGTILHGKKEQVEIRNEFFSIKKVPGKSNLSNVKSIRVSVRRK